MEFTKLYKQLSQSSWSSLPDSDNKMHDLKNILIIVSDCSLYDLHYYISAIFIILPSYFYDDENDVCGIITSLCLCSLWIILNHEYLNIILPTLFHQRPLHLYTSSFLSIRNTVEIMVTSELGALRYYSFVNFFNRLKQ